MLLSLEQSEKQLRESEATNRAMLETIAEKSRELEVAVHEADTANRAKSDFLASMSHELRTPLNAVIGFSQVLQEQYFGSLNDKQTEYVSDIIESGQHLLSLINDILDLSKIESGKIELELSEVSIKELLRGSLVMIKEKAHAHGINLETRVGDEVDSLEITGDERRLKQVMFNLLSNAAKFTPDGGTISVEATRENGGLNISVSDTGIGLSAEEKKKLFQPFYQASGGLKNKTPGTGLGLSITKSIVEKHGGRIWVDSEGLNKGSRFTIALPLTQGAGGHDQASVEAAR
jgi:signal transduction histidine kinase